MALFSFRRRQISLSASLIVMVLVAVLPVLVFSGVLANRLVRTKYESNGRLLNRTATELAYAIDQEIIATMRTLRALSQSSDLQMDQLKAFHRQLDGILSTQPSWSAIVLHDAQAKWLMTSGAALGANLGTALETESIIEVVQSGQPKISRLIPLPAIAGQPLQHAFAVRVPILGANGKVKYVLSARLGTKSVQDIVSRFTTNPGEWVRSIVDDRGMIAARSREPEKFVGEMASEKMRKLLFSKEGGLEQTTTLDKMQVYTAYRRAPLSGWYSIVSVRADVLENEAQQAQNSLIVLSALVLGFSGVAALVVSLWMRGAIKSGSDGAAVLARGEVPTMKPSRITELEELRRSLLAASDLLRSRDRAKSDFLANMSHEIRTPLGIVLGMTELVAAGKVTSQERERMSEIIKRNGQQLLRLIDDILDLAKIESNRLPIDHVDFSLQDLISSVAEDFADRVLENKVKLLVVFEKGSPNIVNSDPIRLRQIIFNLVGNAVKFTHRGQIEVRLHEATGEFAKLTVSDTGIGITPEQKSVLFSNFAQGDTSHSRKYGGSGLGLSLSKKLALLLEGDVRLLQSEINQGSIFEVTFKMRPLANEAHLPVKVESKLPATVEVAKPKRILLAEDSLDNVALIQMYLKNSNAHVSVVSNGVDALSLAQEAEFDLILMDIQMPEMDGYEATRQIREKGIQVPIVALTAHALNEHRERAKQAGFNDYITKPIKRSDLLEALSKHL